MLTKITYIKKLGLVFTDFSWQVATPTFKKVNFIYGWNGCGKTTLTRLFDTISSTAKSDVEYQLEYVGGGIVQTGEVFARPIRVFNKDYIDANVRVLESTASTISVLLGEENKDLLAQIEADSRDLNGDPNDPSRRGKILESSGFNEKKKRKERDNETAFTDVAKTISAAVTGSASASRTYRSPDAKRDFEKLTAPGVLSEEALNERILSIRQVLLPELLVIPRPSSRTLTGARDALDLITTCHTEAADLLSTTVDAQILDRLATHPNLSEWIEHGLHIHNELGARNCEYCGNPISAKRLTQLSRHFSDADRQLKQQLDPQLTVLKAAGEAINGIVTPDAARLYQELQPTYRSALINLLASKAQLLTQIKALEAALQEKKLKTTEALTLNVAINATPLRDSLVDLNTIIETHNKKSKEFLRVQNEAVLAIKGHYLGEIYDDVVARTVEIKSLVEDLAKRSAEIERIRKRIDENRAKISSEHKACEDINRGLKTFLGRDELRFEPESSIENNQGTGLAAVTGYKIVRGAHSAVSLSEGEKTAIAFVYFVVHLNDGQFQKANGIVVIDDPISSLDSNSLYQAFSFLKNAVIGCGQTFVLTHNFDFLKLLLNWRSRSKNDTGYYMINNEIVAGMRRAVIQEMDAELRDYESEYHYLFKRLKQMRADQNGTIMKAYPVPNIARKVWETFLMFRVPSGQNPYNKMETLKQEGFDPLKLDAIYKFTNDQSHMTGAGFNPALVPETKKVLEEMFEIMQKAAPGHFSILDQATQ